MAWIESHQGLGRHIKTKRLARKLKVDIPTAIGHLHLLWWWAMDNIPDGRLSDLEPEDIAEEMMWRGNADDLINALIESGFVDTIDGQLFIHDWHDYIGRLLERRKKETERKRNYRKKSQECPTGQDADDTRDGGGNSTVPYISTTTASDEEEETLGSVYTKVFKTLTMDGLTSDFFMSLRNQGYAERFCIELLLEAGETCQGPKPSLRYLKTICDRWIKENIYTRQQAKAMKTANNVKGIPVSPIPAPKPVSVSDEELRMLEEMDRRAAERNRASNQ